MDLNSAFNTVKRHQMIKKLHHFNIPTLLIHWVHNFLSNRPQAVRIGTVSSSTLITNTGAPQGCVFSPFLNTLYTMTVLALTLHLFFFSFRLFPF
ncbi:MAG: reverse transcriptase domain-containing protein, partial [Sarcina sp.]